ncbi:MAG: tetratricopeptide repeat protein [Mucilaginibacter sp.]
MKNLYRTALTCLFIILTASVTRAQDTRTPKELIAEGIKLHDEGKYDEAIAKYDDAIKIDPDNLTAVYEKAFSLYSLRKGIEAIPLAEKLINAGKYKFESYEMLGNIYDDAGQTEKAIEAYKKGIAVNAGYARLRYNLGVAYLRTKRFTEAEECAIAAIRIDDKHPGSQWLYAMANFYQNKRLKTIVCTTSFLLLEPQSARAAKAFAMLQSLLKSGVNKEGDKKINVVVPSSQSDPDYSAEEMMVSLGAASVIDEKLSPMDGLASQLESIYKVAGELAGKKAKEDFFKNFYTEYFYKLAKSDNMPAFARYISVSTFKDENLQWFKENGEKLKALQNWVNDTQRNF